MHVCCINCCSNNSLRIIKFQSAGKNRIIFVIYDSPSAESKELMSKGIDFYSNK